jgi:hypothetical protein
MNEDLSSGESPEASVAEPTTTEPTQSPESSTEHTQQAEPTKPLTEREKIKEAVSSAFETHKDRLTDIKGEPKPTLGKPNRVVDPNAPKTPPVDPTTGRPVEKIAPPTSMGPLLRQKWDRVDNDLQKFISNREKEVQQTLTQTANVRKFFTDVQSIGNNYRDHIAKVYPNQGMLEAMNDLLHFSSQMHNGSGEQKAVFIDNLIRTFKPDLPTFVALSKKPWGPPQLNQPQQQVYTQADVDRMANERAYQMNVNASQAQVNNSVESFMKDPKNEFVQDLRPLMKRIVDAELVNGANVQEVLKNAYEFAKANHPEVRQILQERAAKAKTNAQNQPKARAAASTIKPSLSSGKSPNTTLKPGKNNSLKDATERAWEEVMARHGISQ